MSDLSEIGNLTVVVAGALGSLLLIVFQSRCKRICWGCITRDVETKAPDKPVLDEPVLDEPVVEPDIIREEP
tara:strand:- start:497 stop:712 length:216 start_codon:yes stop_codon:yes gene_type:complete